MAEIPFVPFLGEYEKRHYDVENKDGFILKWCWPNAGVLCAMDGSGRQWKPGECRFRPSATHPGDHRSEDVIAEYQRQREHARQQGIYVEYDKMDSIPYLNRTLRRRERAVSRWASPYKRKFRP